MVRPRKAADIVLWLACFVLFLVQACYLLHKHSAGLTTIANSVDHKMDLDLPPIVFCDSKGFG